MNYEDMTTADVAEMLGLKISDLHNYRALLPDALRKNKNTGVGRAAIFDDRSIYLLKFAIALRTEKKLKTDEIKKKIAVRYQGILNKNVIIDRSEECEFCKSKISILRISSSRYCGETCRRMKRNKNTIHNEEKQKLNKSRNLAGQVNRLNEVIDRQEREKKDLRDRIATLENSLDNLLATISDLRNQQQPQSVQPVEPEPGEVAINDTGKKWWVIKPLQKLLNGGM